MVGRLGRVPRPQGPDAEPEERHRLHGRDQRAINDIKAGKVEYRVDKTAIIHCPRGQGFL